MSTIKDLKNRIRYAKQYNMKGLTERYKLEIELVRRDKTIKELKRKMKYGYSPYLKEEV
jgi:hypothetical protein